MKLTTTIDVQLGRGQNMREQHFARAKRVKAERSETNVSLELHPSRNSFVSVLAYFADLGARITLHRPWARVPLDSDNLSGAFKGVRDEIASFLGVDDKSERLHWIYTQSKQPKGTLPTVTIEVLPVQDIDPQVKRVRELEAGLRQTMDALIEVQQRHDDDGACYCAEWHDKHKPWCLDAKSAIAAARVLLAPRMGGVPVLADSNQPDGVVYMHTKGGQ